jgi:beta-glucanase (GH16 family)
MSLRRSRLAALGVGLAAALTLVTLPAEQVTPPAAAGQVDQQGTTSLMAPVVQPGRRPTTSTGARLAGSVQFRPARAGRPVIVERRLGTGDWQQVAARRQNAAGTVTFTGPAYARGGAPFSYRGVARPYDGLARTVATPQSADVWGPAFTDEFNGRRRLGPKWTDRRSSAASRTCSKVGHPRMSQVRFGTLRLSVKPDPARRDRTCRVDGQRLRYYLNGQVSTQHVPHAFTRGTFAARIKMQRNRGQHGGFWLQPVRPRYLQGRPARSGAEIDVVEFFGQGYPEGGLASFLYNYGINRGQTKIGGMSPGATRALPRGDAWWKSYHVFSLEWTKRSYVFRVDGREHYRTRRGVSGIDEYLILSLLSSDWELAQAQRLGIRPGGTMNVDWVRVWQR